MSSLINLGFENWLTSFNLIFLSIWLIKVILYFLINFLILLDVFSTTRSVPTHTHQVISLDFILKCPYTHTPSDFTRFDFEVSLHTHQVISRDWILKCPYTHTPSDFTRLDFEVSLHTHQVISRDWILSEFTSLMNKD